jgi:uncharacterized delta-60 repeat protein
MAALFLNIVVLAGSIRNATAFSVLDGGFAPSGFNSNATIYAVATQSDGKVIVAGNFTYQAYYGNFTNILRLGTNGSLDYYFGGGSSAVNGPVYSILIEPDDKIILVGAFSMVGGYSRGCIARLSAAGNVDGYFQSPGFNYYVYTVGRQSDGKIVVGGGFTTVGGYTQYGVARLSSSGSYDSTFNPGIAGSGGQAVYSLAVYPDGFPSEDKIIIGGYFNSVQNNTARTNVARLNSNGSLDTSFTGVNMNGSVYAVALDYGPFTSFGTSGSNVEKVLIGGTFTGFSSRDYFARLNDDGTIEFNTSNSYVDGAVKSIRIQSDHLILLAGAFTYSQNHTRNGITRLFPGSSGSFSDVINLDVDWADHSPNGGSGGSLETLAVGGNGAIYVGGGFTAFEGESRPKIARLFPSDE